MCGIAGVLMFDSAEDAPARRVVEAMLPALKHRGPDGEGQWHASTASGSVVALGHTRLAIIDLSDGGRQPMARDRTAVSYNGEIYNYRALRSRLREHGAAFTSESDTEVLLAGYQHWGPSVVDHLDGMFAFGLWDAAQDRLLLARDRFGIKPLYYHRGPQHFVFASEVRALLASGLVRPDLDTGSLWHYLGHQTAPTPTTLLRDVRMLEPGHVMDVSARGQMTTRRYWSLLAGDTRESRGPSEIQESKGPVSEPAALSRVGDLLREAVQSHLVSDVPVGVFLSGGIDSGALVSTLRSLGVTPRTFTVGLDEDAAADESAAARAVAEAFGTDHAEIRLRGSDIVGMLPGALSAVDHPSGDGLNTFVVSKAAHDRGLKVALSGLGGDEIFGGYPSFQRLSRLWPAARRMSQSPVVMRQAAAKMLRRASRGGVAAEKAAAVLETDGSLAEIWPLTRQVLSAGDRRDVLLARDVPDEAAANTYVAMLAQAFEEFSDAGLWARISYAESAAYMHDVLLRDTDQMSMAHGLEVRVPLLDHRLASYVVSLPDALKSGGVTPKSLLVKSLERPLPGAIVHQPKRGFALPFDTWMRGPLRTFCDAQLGDRGLDGRGILRPGAASGLWARFLRREAGVTWSRVWVLVALNAWLDRQGVRAS